MHPYIFLQSLRMALAYSSYLLLSSRPVHTYVSHLPIYLNMAISASSIVVSVADTKEPMIRALLQIETLFHISILVP